MSKKPIQLFFIFSLLLSLSSCSVVEGIFKVGMGAGIFIIVAIIAVVVYIITRFTKNK